MKLKHWLATLILISCNQPVLAGYTALYAFGDSLSDSGNLYNLVYAASGGTVQVPPPPYYQGRASNGPVAVEYLAAALGLAVQPVITPDGNLNPAGTNFAVLGSATGPVNQSSATWSNYMPFRYNPLLPDVGMGEQVTGFSVLTGGLADPNALYFLWGGANDAYLALEDPAIDQTDAISMGSLSQSAATTAVDNMGNLIRALAGMGARNFLVPNLPDLGRTPDALSGAYGSAYAGALSNYTRYFNSTLSPRLQALNADPLIEIIPFDVAALFDDLNTSGLYDVTTPCILNPLCDADNTLFWDGVHPTTTFHAELGFRMARAVPEPDVFWLIAPGLVFLVARRRITRRQSSIS
ncbi:MAG: SGNH/GDSL hydrolase family protein [Pseudomonadota bacterium]